MALINSGQIELLDLTDARAAVLTLNTSLSKIQIQSEGNFRPNYKNDLGKVPEYDDKGFPKGTYKNTLGLCIYPSLYLGQDLMSITSYSDKIIYYIGEESYSKNNSNPNADIYVNEFGELIYLKNLEDNTLFISAEIEEYDYGVFHYEDILGQLEIIKITSDLNCLPLIEYNKNVFSSYDKEDIILTAKLYQGGEELSIEQIEYEWFSNPEVSFSNGPENNQITISRNQIINLATIFCNLKTKTTGRTYTSQVTIYDKTDPLSSQIISSNGLVFTGAETTTSLTCDIYRGTQLVNPEDSDFEYRWSYLQEGDNTFTELITDKKKKTIEVTPQKLSSGSITFHCEATNNVETTNAQIAIIISPAFKAIINPTQIFIATKEDGSLPDDSFIQEKIIEGEEEKKIRGFTKQLLFKLVDEQGVVLPMLQNDIRVEPQINFGEKTNPFVINIKEDEKNKYNFIIKIDFIENNDDEDTNFTVKDLENSSLFIIEYNYRGAEPIGKQFQIQLSEEFYIIKNIQGESGDEITQAIDLYTLGNYKFQKGFLYDKDGLKYNENGIKYYVIKEGENHYIFDAFGEILYDEQKNIVENDADGNPLYVEKEDEDGNFREERVIFLLAGDVITRKSALLKIYEDTVWAEEIPSIAVDLAVEKNDLIEFNEDDDNIVVEPLEIYEILIGDSGNNEKDFYCISQYLSSQSLWVKSKFFWKDKEYPTYSSPILAESLQELKISASQSNIIYSNDSVKTIISQQDWYNTIIGALQEDVNKNIPAEIDKKVSNDDLQLYVRFGNEIGGVEIGHSNSYYSTLTNESGYYIQYQPEGSTATNKIIVGSFDNIGLNTKEISLVTNHLNNSQEAIVLTKGTPTGGWVWTKGSRRGGAI